MFSVHLGLSLGAPEVRPGFFSSFHLFYVSVRLMTKKTTTTKKKKKHTHTHTHTRTQKSVFTKREVLPGLNAHAEEDLAEAILIAIFPLVESFNF